jgi:hypothetical protein
MSRFVRRGRCRFCSHHHCSPAFPHETTFSKAGFGFNEAKGEVGAPEALCESLGGMTAVSSHSAAQPPVSILLQKDTLSGTTLIKELAKNSCCLQKRPIFGADAFDNFV